jgi:hypothetical protein
MSDQHRCYVCGFELDDEPWSNKWIFEYCLCCGCQFGYEDASTKAILIYRQNWLNSGATWFKPDKRPANWSLENQLAKIPKQIYPDILQNDKG